MRLSVTFRPLGFLRMLIGLVPAFAVAVLPSVRDLVGAGEGTGLLIVAASWGVAVLGLWNVPRREGDHELVSPRRVTSLYFVGSALTCVVVLALSVVALSHAGIPARTSALGLAVTLVIAAFAAMLLDIDLAWVGVLFCLFAFVTSGALPRVLVDLTSNNVSLIVAVAVAVAAHSVLVVADRRSRDGPLGVLKNVVAARLVRN